MPNRRLIALTCTLAALALAGCGSDDGDDSGGGEGAQSVDITATDFKFDPAEPKVDKTGPYTFNLRNDGEAPHALEVEGPGGEVKTGEVQPGETAAVEVDLSEPGEYTMYCPVGNHRQMGMEGKVVVAGDGGSGDSGQSEDESGGGSGYGY
jgi:plastocyanin